MPQLILNLSHYLFPAMIMGRHKLRPLTILTQDSGCHDAVVVADKFNDVLIFSQGRLVEI